MYVRTMKDISSSFQPLEQIIKTKLIPALTGKSPPNVIEHNLLTLPAQLKGMALANPPQVTNAEYLASNKIDYGGPSKRNYSAKSSLNK